MTVTLEQLKAMVMQLKKHAVPAKTIETQEEADSCTQDDLIGHEWKVGDKFYKCLIHPSNLDFAEELRELPPEKRREIFLPEK